MEGLSAARGEGRAKNEKSQSVHVPGEIRKSWREQRAAQEAEWASRSGPVTIKKKRKESA